MRQVSEQDKKVYEGQYKKLEGIKEELKHSHSLDILQAIIIRYNLVNVKSEEVIRYTIADHKAGKKLNKIESRIDQLIFDALYKELEKMKHELRHCNSLDQLDTLVQHHAKINTDTDAVLRHITKNSAAQAKILKLEKGIAEQLFNKKKEFSPKQETTELISDESTSTDSGENDQCRADTLVVENTRLSDTIPHIEPEDPLIAVKYADNPPIHQDPVSAVSPVINTSNSNIIMEAKPPIKPVDEMTKTCLLTIQQKKERELQLGQFDKVLKQLVGKRDEFHLSYPKECCDDVTKAYGAAYQLVKKLTGFSHSYKEGIMDLKMFKEQATKEIREQRKGVLSEHRGCKELVANLLFAIGTLGVGYALAALYTQSFLPIKLNTHTVDCMDKTLKSVEQVERGLEPVKLKI
jgi:hypothetical protein